MSDAAVFDDELKSLEEHVQSCLRAMDTTSGDARQDKYNRAQELLKSAQRTFHHLKVEIRQLDPVEAADYERRCKEHNVLITQLKEQLAAKKNEPAAAASSGGGGGYGGGGAGGAGDFDDGKGRARQTKDRISTTQNHALAALDRIERTVEDTKGVGDQTAQKLAEQTEQMHRMNDKLDKLDSEVDRAKSELNAFIRRMMTDKIILCFILLVVIAVVAIVIIKLKGDPDAVSFSPPPPPPAPITPPPTPSPTQ
jgi:novel plant SNARE